jgi:hypothetical protein
MTKSFSEHDEQDEPSSVLKDADLSSLRIPGIDCQTAYHCAVERLETVEIAEELPAVDEL